MSKGPKAKSGLKISDSVPELPDNTANSPEISDNSQECIQMQATLENFTVEKEVAKPKKLKNTFADKIIINLSRCHYDVIKEVIKKDFPFFATSNSENFYKDDWDLFWQDGGIDSEKLVSMKPYQRVNHFPAMFLIHRKTFLAKNLKKMKKNFPEDYDFFPRTWILPNEINDLKIAYQYSLTEKIDKKIRFP